MGLLLFSAFIIVPLIEIGLFIEVGGVIGLWPTILVVIATAVAGSSLLRHQGLGALNRLQDSLNKGEALVGPLFDGFCLLAAGTLLLTPGFFTDVLGFLLFIPPVRRTLGRLLARRIQARHTGPRNPGSGGIIIDGEWQDITGAANKPKSGARLPATDDHRDVSNDNSD